jgi:hypothetical protein
LSGITVGRHQGLSRGVARLHPVLAMKLHLELAADVALVVVDLLIDGAARVTRTVARKQVAGVRRAVDGRLVVGI